MKALICGDRNYADVARIREWIVKLVALGCDTIIEGECRGADIISREIALELNLNVLRYPAKWQEYREKYPIEKYGMKFKSAGNDRNTQMLEEGKPDIVIAFHKDFKHSKGTKDMVSKAQKAKVKTIIVEE